QGEGRAEQWLAEGMAEWAAFTVLERLGLDTLAERRAAALGHVREQAARRAPGSRDPRHAARLHSAPPARGLAADLSALVPHDRLSDPPPRLRRSGGVLPIVRLRQRAARCLPRGVRPDPGGVRGRDAALLRPGTALSLRRAWLPALLLFWSSAASADSPLLVMATEVRPTAAIVWA